MPSLRYTAPAVLLSLLVAPWSHAAERTHAEAEKLAARVLEHAIVLDTHEDTPQMLLDNRYDLADPASPYMVSIPKMRQGHVGGAFFSIWVDVKWPQATLIQRALDLIDAVDEQVARHSDTLGLVTTADDVVRLHRNGKIAILMGLEGGHIICDDLRVLDSFYRLGVRYMTLTHTANTDWADSSAGKPYARGLTDFGRQVVARLNRLGMMVDISHVSDQTFYAALAASKAPLIASHSSCRALSNQKRNMSDEMIRALAKNGGVIQINFYSAFLDPDYASALKKVQPQIDAAVAAERKVYAQKGRQLPWREEQKIGQKIAAGIPAPPLKRVADHIDHAVQVGGVDHVGLGSDFDGIESAPKGLEDISKIPDLVIELARRGYSEEDLEKILGGNLLRVMRRVEDVSLQMQKEK
ncbi:MAG: dipeptidase [Acidobacteriia bacterium]|nr:dipeptidase [Terriglobia bacterium]